MPKKLENSTTKLKIISNRELFYHLNEEKNEFDCKLHQ